MVNDPPRVFAPASFFPFFRATFFFVAIFVSSADVLDLPVWAMLCEKHVRHQNQEFGKGEASGTQQGT
jgi:hypothetical protein